MLGPLTVAQDAMGSASEILFSDESGGSGSGNHPGLLALIVGTLAFALGVLFSHGISFLLFWMKEEDDEESEEVNNPNTATGATAASQLGPSPVERPPPAITIPNMGALNEGSLASSALGDEDTKVLSIPSQEKNIQERASPKKAKAKKGKPKIQKNDSKPFSIPLEAKAHGFVSKKQDTLPPSGDVVLSKEARKWGFTSVAASSASGPNQNMQLKREEVTSSRAKVPGGSVSSVPKVEATLQSNSKMLPKSDSNKELERHSKDRQPQPPRKSPRQTQEAKISNVPKEKPKAVRRVLTDQLMEYLNKQVAPQTLYWEEDGLSFSFDTETVQKEILDPHFRGTKIASLQRSLNRWGFKRINDETDLKNIQTYSHPMFKKSRPDMALQIKMGEAPQEIVRERQQPSEEDTSSSEEEEEEDDKEDEDSDREIEALTKRMATNIKSGRRSLRGKFHMPQRKDWMTLEEEMECIAAATESKLKKKRKAGEVEDAPDDADKQPPASRDSATSSGNSRKMDKAIVMLGGNIDIGCRLEVFWPDEQEYYPGTITEKRGDARAKKPFYVQYDDGDSEWINLDENIFRIIDDDSEDAAAPTSSGELKPEAAARNSPPVKRPRGRPRKNPPLEETKIDPENTEKKSPAKPKTSTPNKNNVAWDGRYFELKAFIERVGHANPRYGSGTSDSCPHLAQWLANQRSDFRLGKKITFQRVRLLHELGCHGFEIDGEEKPAKSVGVVAQKNPPLGKGESTKPEISAPKQSKRKATDLKGDSGASISDSSNGKVEARGGTETDQKGSAASGEDKSSDSTDTIGDDSSSSAEADSSSGDETDSTTEKEEELRQQIATTIASRRTSRRAVRMPKRKKGMTLEEEMECITAASEMKIKTTESDDSSEEEHVDEPQAKPTVGKVAMMNAPTPELNAPPAKRGRGRPRKSPSLGATTDGKQVPLGESQPKTTAGQVAVTDASTLESKTLSQAAKSELSQVKAVASPPPHQPASTSKPKQRRSVAREYHVFQPDPRATHCVPPTFPKNEEDENTVLEEIRRLKTRLTPERLENGRACFACAYCAWYRYFKSNDSQFHHFKFLKHKGAYVVDYRDVGETDAIEIEYCKPFLYWWRHTQAHVKKMETRVIQIDEKVLHTTSPPPLYAVFDKGKKRGSINTVHDNESPAKAAKTS